jgi:hypothetical protein
MKRSSTATHKRLAGRYNSEPLPLSQLKFRSLDFPALDLTSHFTWCGCEFKFACYQFNTYTTIDSLFDNRG